MFIFCGKKADLCMMGFVTYFAPWFFFQQYTIAVHIVVKDSPCEYNPESSVEEHNLTGNQLL